MTYSEDGKPLKAKRISAAHAKAHLAEIAGRVAYGGEHFIIERRGKPIAALVSMEDLEWLEQERVQAGEPRYQGALALLGAWRDVPDEKIDAVIAEIYEARARDTARPVSLED